MSWTAGNPQPQPPRAFGVMCFLLSGCFAFPAFAADFSTVQLETRFTSKVRPFLETYCVSCHSGAKPKADLNLSDFNSMSALARDHAHWSLVLERLEANEMPPAKAERQPTAALRKEVVEWIRAARRYEARKNAGDPGPVLARRLSNAEYNYTIRDLTGVDIRPTREFPVDPANQAGFDNSGESLAMSPSLLKKYLEAARRVSEFLVLKPEGFTFAPHPMIADTDRDKYSVNRIISFYQRQATNYADYFEAAWRFQHRAALGKSKATLVQFAGENKVSAKYLATIWDTLAENLETVGPVAKLQAMWRALPPPVHGVESEAVRAGCEQMRNFVLQLRPKLTPVVANLTGGRMNQGSQPLLMWKNRQWAANRLRYDRSAMQVQNTAKPGDSNPPTEIVVNPKAEQAAAATAALGRTNAASAMRSQSRGSGRATVPDPDLMLPADLAERARYEAGFERFCRVFPDAFYVSERGRTYADQEKEIASGRAGRLLNAGFHSMTGYFRDDKPLYDLILDEQGQRELDQLWNDFTFMSSIPIRMHTSFLWFERSDSSFMMSSEFNFTRPEDKSCTDEPILKRLAETFAAKARANGASEIVLQAIKDHFDSVNANVRWLERTRLAAESSHLKAMLAFAERAYRRPLSQTERDGLLAFYRSLREQGGSDHEEAIRDTVVSILMSPNFCYRVDLVEAAGTESRAQTRHDEAAIARRTGSEVGISISAGARPLSDYALASRLSYFLWSSMPDAQLLARAAAGDLHKPGVIAAQARRMLKDEGARGLAVEFGGNWLDFRRFEEHNAVDRERFPTFNNELRTAMFEEPLRFFQDVVRRDRSVLDFLYANDTFVNPVLAKHYGLPEVLDGDDHWLHVERAGDFGRGGLLPMAVFLTANSPGLRTSPVKRGYWVVRRLLGEVIPPPPPNVPVLPADEANMGDLTLREALAKHRADPNCAACHARFDSFGLVFENYGPIGERRTKDLGGRPVDTRAEFPGGKAGTGLEGLRSYIRERRQDDFVDNLCRKLLAYALGRTLLPSDDLAIESMRAKLAANSYRFGTLVESIVTSPQFLTKRGSNDLAMKGN